MCDVGVSAGKQTSESNSGMSPFDPNETSALA